ncbi:MAG: indole-3-glycerol-phosphate synthase [Deltaproteobacteria bacterium]|nr:indole-3-glycerol-phosphate synthase [Deltaproteobacteria bacterium]
MNKDLSLSRAILEAKESGRVPVIADIKPASPRDGNLLGNRGPGQMARIFGESGVCALSVVTEERHFGGSMEILQEVVRATHLPVLRKDFVSSPRHVIESREAGASAVLLIMATTPDPLAPMLHQQIKDLGMETVVEIHSQEELHRALGMEPAIIGINNRNILELETDSGDVRVTEELAPLVPKNVLIISESSLRSAHEIQRAFHAGADAVLIGTALLLSSDPRSFLADLTRF